jgi:preprotein translocase subunit SecE
MGGGAPYERNAVGEQRQGLEMPNPVEFMQEVRDEARKVSWPTRKELVVSTIMVFIMVVVASIFFLGVDAVLKYVVDGVLFGFKR